MVVDADSPGYSENPYSLARGVCMIGNLLEKSCRYTDPYRESNVGLLSDMVRLPGFCFFFLGKSAMSAWCMLRKGTQPDAKYFSKLGF